MNKSYNVFWVDNSLRAWEAINEAFIKADSTFMPYLYGHNALYSYDFILGIKNPYIDPDFDFGRHFNYTIAKWRSLVSNYLDLEELNEIKREVAKEESKRSSSKVYNLALQFTNKHGHGKNCLLSMVFSRRFGGTKATIEVFMRASEVTKRLICDLLFFQRIGEYVYGEGKYQLVIHFNQLFNDDTVLLMYHAHRDVRKILKGIKGDRSHNLLELLNKLENKNPEDIKYKVHRRAAKVLHPELYKYPKTLVKDCNL